MKVAKIHRIITWIKQHPFIYIHLSRLFPNQIRNHKCSSRTGDVAQVVEQVQGPEFKPPCACAHARTRAHTHTHTHTHEEWSNKNKNRVICLSWCLQSNEGNGWWTNVYIINTVISRFPYGHVCLCMLMCICSLGWPKQGQIIAKPSFQ
jgi:hypothetical protein